jgi:hypothetical protein
MENDLRLKALARLARSGTEAAKAALELEFDETLNTLKTQSDYQVLRQSLDVLDAIGFRFSDRAVASIEDFIQTVDARELTHSQSEGAFADYIAKYSDATSLIVKAVEVVVRLRYYETRGVLRILLPLFQHPAASVRAKVAGGLDALSRYAFEAFYGPGGQGGVGAAPQAEVVSFLDAMGDPELEMNHEASLRLLTGILSPMIQGVSVSSSSVTFSRASTPAHLGVESVRERGIQLLCRLYSLSGTAGEKISVITALSQGASASPSAVADDAVREMIARDTVKILEFFESLVPIEELQVLQKIETASYWMFVRALNESVRNAAAGVEKAIAGREDYEIYRILIGFEGIFGDWSSYEERRGQFEAVEEYRRERAQAFALSITWETYQEWRARILEFAKTQSSDLATFPVFYHFLAKFAAARPELALRLLVDDANGVARFLIPLLSGLWNGGQKEKVRALVERWIAEANEDGQYFLFSATKMFLSAEDLDIALLKKILSKADALNDASCVRQVVAVAVVRWTEDREAILRDLFFPALDILTRMNDASWIFEAWFRNEARNLIGTLDREESDRVLRNLLVLPEIDYHAEELLFGLSLKNPEHVCQFFVERIGKEQEQPSDMSSRPFHAIPFEFSKLQQSLSQTPEFAVRSVLEQFRRDATLFAFRGARLLKNIFPSFSESFEAVLLQLVRQGDDGNVEFVLGVLRNYHGEPFLHPLCKEIVKALPVGSSLLRELEIALLSTGVVSGEFGFAEAYERKQQEMSDWLTDLNENVRAFASQYVADLGHMREQEFKRASEGIALRRHRFDD